VGKGVSVSQTWHMLGCKVASACLQAHFITACLWESCPSVSIL
jgi:hypothetical protein